MKLFTSRGWAALIAALSVSVLSLVAVARLALGQTAVLGRDYGNGKNRQIEVDSNGALILSPDGGLSFTTTSGGGGGGPVTIAGDGGTLPVAVVNSGSSPVPVNNSAQTSSQQTVTLCTTAVKPVPASPLASRRSIEVCNEGTFPVYIGTFLGGVACPSAIDAGTVPGEPVQPSQCLSKDTNQAIYCVACNGQSQVSPDAGLVAVELQ